LRQFKLAPISQNICGKGCKLHVMLMCVNFVYFIKIYGVRYVAGTCWFNDIRTVCLLNFLMQVHQIILLQFADPS